MLPSPPDYTIPSFQLAERIGSGTIGTVYRIHPSAIPLAVKIIPPAKVHHTVRREVDIHKSLHHPNIAPLHMVTTAQPTTPSPSPPMSLALVMSHATLGDMFSEVSSAGSLPPRVLRRRLQDIVAALTYLHDMNIAHLDVKLENVVINNNSSAQLIDFGCAQRLDRLSGPTSIGGTLHYLPPEYISTPTTAPSTAADAWSLGVLAYTALAGCYPFNAASDGVSDELNDSATRDRILRCDPHPLPAHIEPPSDLVHIIHSLLQKDPAQRMTIPQVAAVLRRSESPFRIPMRIRKPVNYCPHGRPRSPAAACDADFAPCECVPQQTDVHALQVVDNIMCERSRAKEEVGRFLTSKNAYAVSTLNDKEALHAV